MPERTYTRRSILRAATLLPAAVVTAAIIHESMIGKEIDLAEYKATTIAHNAALNPEKLYRAINSSANFVEVDITMVDGKPVVAHTPAEYRELGENQRKLQDVGRILGIIKDAGKHPMFDLKDEVIELSDLQSVHNLLLGDQLAMASSNRHKLLESLRGSGFDGIILYSIGTKETFKGFELPNLDPSTTGVSIQWKLLRDGGADRIKGMGLAIAAWNPKSPEEIRETCNFGIDMLTSDNLELLNKIGKSGIMVAGQEHQLPPVG